MRKKIVAVMLVVAVSAMTLVGCGHGNDTSSASAECVEDTGPAIPEDVVNHPEETSAIIEGETTTDVAEDDYDFGRPPEEDLVPWDEMESEDDTEEISAETGEIEGIVVLTLYPDKSGYMNALVNLVNPNGNNSHNLLSLHFPLVNAKNEYGYIMPLDNPRFCNYQDQFSFDYSKMAITRMYTSDRSMHAGWLDQSGNFFDVTEALGDVTDSLSDVVHYQAVGFTDSGQTFVYKEVADTNAGYWYDTIAYYAVSVNDIENAAPQRIQSSDAYLHDDANWDWLNDYMPSDWVDDTHFYANADPQKSQCMLVDVDTQTMVDFLPSETQERWSMVSSPDGQKVAFMSRAKTGQTQYAELCTMDPVTKKDNHILTIEVANDARTMSIYGKATEVDTLCAVLDWR